MKRFFDVEFTVRQFAHGSSFVDTIHITIYAEGDGAEDLALITVRKLYPDGVIRKVIPVLFPDALVYGLFPEEAISIYAKYLAEYEEARSRAIRSGQAMDSMRHNAISQWDDQFGIEFPVVAGEFLIEMDTEDGTVTVKKVNRLGIKNQDQ